MIKYKSGVFEKFKEYRALVKKQIGKVIETLPRICYYGVLRMENKEEETVQLVLERKESKNVGVV